LKPEGHFQILLELFIIVYNIAPTQNMFIETYTITLADQQDDHIHVRLLFTINNKVEKDMVVTTIKHQVH